MRHFFIKCARIEETVAAAYRELAAILPENHELVRIFLELEKDEKDHAMQLRFAARLPEEDTAADPRLPEATVDQLLRRADDFLQMVGSRTLKVEDALPLALRMEKEFCCVHAHCAAEFVDERMARMFRALAWDDERHEQALAEYCRKTGMRVVGEGA